MLIFLVLMYQLLWKNEEYWRWGDVRDEGIRHMKYILFWLPLFVEREN